MVLLGIVRESIKEDDDGLVESAIIEIIQKAKRQRQLKKRGHRRLGIMRHLNLVIDCSEAMSYPDLKPTRMLCTANVIDFLVYNLFSLKLKSRFFCINFQLLEVFIEEFFDQNPICQIGLILMKDKRAEKLSELSGSARKHIRSLKELHKISLVGEPSLQNGLDLARQSLKILPSHASREIVVIMGSLTTCDPSDILTTIEDLKKDGIRCSVISLSAEIRVCRYLTEQTSGSLAAVLDGAHYRDQLLQHIDPPLANRTQENSLIKMGFPHVQNEEGKDPPLTMCMCHIDNTDDSSKLTTGGFNCPQCDSKYCELPLECLSCGLTLVSAPHLARSYHHLFPTSNFIECPYKKQIEKCYACQKIFTDGAADKLIYRCPHCHQFFCNDCDIFIHETLHSCVGCATIPKPM